ncbi:hypothetical protein GC093_25580 [Paenibacillus sp. LMG 31456]|uniref:Uncharacterized protein n=1 Tax=Paenibacillus foliorum TaxID=2654974 RepID=A0A972K335_9BACL|nr:P1 family peptidase [Paenibacillus foliorum]NOU96565.1 hypothetical protein [Paenibacillus foliorum]
MEPRQLKRIAKRAGVGLAHRFDCPSRKRRDIAITFSNSNRIAHTPKTDFLQLKSFVKTDR